MFRGIEEKQYGRIAQTKLFSLAKDNLSLVQRLKLYRSLNVHNGCVNSICWNETGSCILSGSDDQHLVISSPFTGQTLGSIRSGHRANIFSAKFLPSTLDKQIVSCSGDGKIYYTLVDREDTYNSNCFNCHHGTSYEVLTIPNESSTFLSCGEDGTVRWFDLRMKTHCDKQNCKEDVLIKCRRPVTSLTLNPMLPFQLGLASSDSAVRIYDRRMLGTHHMGNYCGQSFTGLMCRFSAKCTEKRSYRITSLQYSSDGEEMLVNYSSERLYLFNIKEGRDYKALHKELPPIPDHSKSHPAFSIPTQNVNSEILPIQPSTSQDAPESNEMPSRHPNIKRLRLRGDWSDTGPNARPASQRHMDEEESPQMTLMQRMSDMLTRWLDTNLRPDNSLPSISSQSEERETMTESESTPEGAVGVEPSQLPSSHPGLIQNLENIEIPDECQMDIGDHLKNLSKFHENANRGLENPVETTVSSSSQNQYGSSSFSPTLHPTVGLSESSVLTEGDICQTGSVDPVSVADDGHESMTATNTNTDITDVLKRLSKEYQAKENLLAPNLSGEVANASSHFSSTIHGNRTDHVSSADKVHQDFVTDNDTCSSDMGDAACDTDNDGNCDSNPPNMPENSRETIVEQGETIMEQGETIMEQRETIGEERETIVEQGETIMEQRETIGEERETIVEQGETIEEQRETIMEQESGRRRRIGYSGPPTGDFQLLSSEDTSSEDNTIDSPSVEREDEYLERSIAAIKLQSIFRKRQAEREEKQLESTQNFQPTLKQKYRGHRNARTMIKEANFWGEKYVMSGSDCGHIFIWDRYSSKLTMLLEADRHVVNCLQPHPFDPVLASSGIDYDIKVWSPLSTEPEFDEDAANEIIFRNELMLEETQDTITVPAAFMFRVLASLNHIRSGRDTDDGHSSSD